MAKGEFREERSVARGLLVAATQRLDQRPAIAASMDNDVALYRTQAGLYYLVYHSTEFHFSKKRSPDPQDDTIWSIVDEDDWTAFIEMKVRGYRWMVFDKCAFKVVENRAAASGVQILEVADQESKDAFLYLVSQRQNWRERETSRAAAEDQTVVLLRPEVEVGADGPTVLHVPLPQGVKRRLEAMAKNNGMTTSEFAGLLLSRVFGDD